MLDDFGVLEGVVGEAGPVLPTQDQVLAAWQLLARYSLEITEMRHDGRV